MSFAEDFRRHAIPRLRKVTRQISFFAALDGGDAEEVHEAVLAEANRLGCHKLGGRLADLDDWITRRVAAEFPQAIERVQGHQAAIAAELLADPAAHYATLAEGCANHEPMRWAFAALCPEYRAKLIAERKSNDA